MMAEKPRTISDSESEIGHDAVSDIMNSSQISNVSTDSVTFAKNNYNISHNISGKSLCRFPKLEECAHFHYERVQLGKINVRLVDEKIDPNVDAVSQTKSYLSNNGWFIVRVSAGRSESFLIRRTVENLKMLDKLLHQCVYDRKISGLEDLTNLDVNDSQIETTICKYLTRFSLVASDAMTCGPVLTWLQLDNKGRRLPVADTDTMRTINTPAVGAAYGVKRYVAQACDEISIEVGDMISVIDMPSPAESVWWRGKKSHLQKSQYEVGFFPQSCVATIGDKVPRHMPLPAPLVGSLAVSPTKPVLRKHGKLIAFFRSFILSRPSRRRLKQSGIYKERVFSCDLSEHLLNSGQDIPMVLKCCAEFIEEFGIVDGIYRLSGITSNIQKLRRAFDEERIPDLTHPEIRQDIHAVSSLLKMYFRELPNPLCTYQLYDNFVDAIQNRSDGEEYRLKRMKETVQKLPPPHYRTLKYLSTHLNKISRYSDNTGMTDRNLAIVWAPNLLRSPALESGGVAALRGVGVQAVVTEYLITNCEHIFNSDDDFTRFPPDPQLDSLTDSDSFVDQREHEQSFERPKSLNVGGAKLLSLEEAQLRVNRSENIDINKTIQLNTSALQGGYIEVGGGPSSLPDKYHTVLPVPRSWQKRKTHSWKSLFSRGQRTPTSNQGGSSGSGAGGAGGLLSKSGSAVDHHHQLKMQIHKIETSDLDEKENKPSNFNTTSVSQGKLSKHCDMFEGKSITTMDVCVRSNSIDSLRTAGHSRSVSHDSYFDLLQSPLRTAMGMDNSREMSELGLNFDREEPEMRIFSESESLVSSPKIIKEPAIVPTTRKVMRARPEEYSSTANSVNPSPKKQPRLNIQQNSSSTTTANEITNWLNNSHDESSCKRYKLEDQLSDIQYIDCCTPEHTINTNNNNANVTTIYTSVQIHNPPQASSASSSHEMLNVGVDANNAEKIKTRYSYPGKMTTSLDGGGGAVTMAAGKEGRFSFPISCGEKFGMGKFFQTNNDHNKLHFVGEKKMNDEKRCNDFQSAGQTKNRYSFYETSINQPVIEAKNDALVLRSSSAADVFNQSAACVKSNSMNRSSKLSVATPQSPVQSPRYSLLVGGDTTSSEASSSLNTPTYDHSRNSFETNHHHTKDLDKRKCEMSLDLNVTHTTVTDTHSTSGATPNHTHTSTDGTSQSMTPSEFGYQNLNRTQSTLVTPDNSPMKSTPPTSAISDILNYENLDPMFYEGSSVAGLKLPIKATISITYKSPTKTKSESSIISDDVYDDVTPVEDVDGQTATAVSLAKKNILETTFDDKMVYEQVKFYKSTITEINQMLDNGNHNDDDNDDDKKIADDSLTMDDHVVPCLNHLDNENNENGKRHYTGHEEVDMMTAVDDKTFNEDIAMSSDHDSDVKDSLEFDQNNLSLYENVHVKQPAKVYENVDLSSTEIITNEVVGQKTVTKQPQPLPPGEIKPGNFIVRQLATKFETSPVENLPPFDFGKPNGKKMNGDQNRNSPCMIRANNNTRNYDKKLKITRSLDENAFVREFGTKRLENINQSVQQIHDFENILSESRRKSLEFTRPKSLNPPKKLPQITNEETNEICKSTNNTKIGGDRLKLDFTKFERNPEPQQPIKITPTTENRISLIQNNITAALVSIEDGGGDKTNNVQPSKIVLENVKLDRERIEKIKEERRLQLNEKFRSESFRGGDKRMDYQCLKSKSKTELRDLKCENGGVELATGGSVKSKSRNDVRSIVENNHEMANNYFSRVRRTSDEKNQNEVMVSMGSTVSSPTSGADSGSGDKLRKKLEKRDSVDYQRERENLNTKENSNAPVKCSQVSQRDRISPQRSIKDVAAMFESRMQNQ